LEQRLPFAIPIGSMLSAGGLLNRSYVIFSIAPLTHVQGIQLLSVIFSWLLISLLVWHLLEQLQGL
jgi:hypothetical protein